jgi:hypothetical protein
MHAYPETSAVDFEHVCLSSVEADDPQPNFMPSAVIEALDQSSSREERSLVIFDRAYLGVRISKRSAPPQKYWLRMAFLDPSPVKRASRAWWSVACALALGSAFMLILSWHSGMWPSTFWTAGVFAMVVAAVSSLGFAWHRSRDRLVFYTRHGRVPVAELVRHRPDRRTSGRFLAALEQAIQRAADEHRGPRAQLLREEMREHRRLRDDGVLAPEEFEAAKARILQAHG